MPQIRQRKRTAGKDDSPPDLVECDSSSSDVYFDGDDGANPTGNGSANINHEERTLLTKPEPPNPTNEPGKLDKFLSVYCTFCGSTFTADQGFKILQWSSWAIAYAIRRKRGGAMSPSLRKLSNEVSMARYLLRLFGFLQSLEGYRSGSWAGGNWDDGRIGKIAKYLMAGSMLIYYPLEHVAYAGWQMPKLVKVNANKVSAISCVFWTTYIIGDFWASCLKWKELKAKLADSRQVLVGKKWSDDKEAITDLPKEERAILNKIRHIKLQLLRCLLFILPAVNWSLPNWATDPLLGELPLNGLMTAEAYASVYQSLRSMCG